MQRAHPVGIRRHRDGWQAYVRVRGKLVTKTFPAAATVRDMQDWRTLARAGALTMRAATARPGDTFRDDADRYLQAVKAMPTYGQRELHITEWVAVFGDRPRASIAPADIQAHLQRLTAAGSAASTVNHRRTALMHLYRVLDGKAATNPVRDVPKRREPDPEPRALPLETVAAIVAELHRARDSVSAARIDVLAATGLPPAQLRACTALHYDQAARLLWVPGRLKGHGTRGRFLPLTASAVAACDALTSWSGWGPFNVDALNRVFKRACARLQAARLEAQLERDPTLDRATLYDLRHTVATTLYAASGDIHATQQYLGHADPRTTARYAVGGLAPRLRLAVAQLEQAQSGGRKLPG